MGIVEIQFGHFWLDLQLVNSRQPVLLWKRFSKSVTTLSGKEPTQG